MNTFFITTLGCKVNSYEIDAIKDELINNGYVYTNELEADYIIIGESVMRPKKSYSYRYEGGEEGSWTYDTSLPLTAKISDNVITLTWTENYSDKFTLSFGNTTKEISVKSLFE